MERWAGLFSEKIKDLPEYEIEALHDRYEVKGIPVASGLISSVENGIIAVYSADIHMQSAKGRPPNFVTSIRKQQPTGLEEPRVAVIGEQEFLGEFFEGTTERAKTEQLNYESDLLVRPVSNRIAFTAERLVALGIQYASDPATLAGPVDVLHLDSTGDLHWIKRKPACPEIGFQRGRSN